MTSPTLLSETKIRRHVKGHRTPRKSTYLHSDYHEEKDDVDNCLGPRSVSLTTLQHSAPEVGPRMAQLETLEAKMASIEVSLSTTPRRKKNGSIGGGSTSGLKTSSIRSDVVSRELDNLKHALRDKENIIQSLKGQLHSSPNGRLPPGVLRNTLGPGSRALSPAERRHAEERLSRVKHDMDNKRLAIKNLKMALERLDITDNIDVRIQQAELEYQLGREELNALSLLEEARALQLCLEDEVQTVKPQTTLFSCARGSSNQLTLHAIEVPYDAKSPRFGAGQREQASGLWVEWALEETGICKGDRVVEVNGKLVLNKTKDDMLRLLSVAPDPAQIVVLRSHPPTPACSVISQHSATSNEVANLRAELGLVRERAEEAQRVKDGLKGDNLRLTHRISYLEEQVAELLQRKHTELKVPDARVSNQSPIITSTVKNSQNVTNISITSPPSSPNSRNADLQIFQKGPQVTALVANLPGMEVDNRDMLRTLRPRSVQCNVSSTHIPAPEETNHNYKLRHSRHSSHSGRHLDYNSESSSAIEQIRRHHNHHHHHRKHSSEDKHSSRKSLSGVETHLHRRLMSHKVNDSRSVEDLDCDSDATSRIRDARSVKSLDFDSEPCNIKPIKIHNKHIDYTSEPISNEKIIGYQNSNGDIRHRPKPPKKPLRLSLHRAQSLQSVETPPNHVAVSDKEERKPIKRNHKGEAPQVPTPIMLKIERPSEQPPNPPIKNGKIPESPSSRSSSRAENGHSAIRWTSALHHLGYSRSSSRNNGHLSDGGKWC